MRKLILLAFIIGSAFAQMPDGTSGPYQKWHKKKDISKIDPGMSPGLFSKQPTSPADNTLEKMTEKDVNELLKPNSLSDSEFSREVSKEIGRKLLSKKGDSQSFYELNGTGQYVFLTEAIKASQNEVSGFALKIEKLTKKINCCHVDASKFDIDYKDAFKSRLNSNTVYTPPKVEDELKFYSKVEYVKHKLYDSYLKIYWQYQKCISDDKMCSEQKVEDKSRDNIFKPTGEGTEAPEDSGATLTE